MNKNFEDFLADIHGVQYFGIDDNMPDDFNKWIQDLEVDDWLRYGDRFIKQQRKELLEAYKVAEGCLSAIEAPYRGSIATLYLDKLKQAIANAEKEEITNV